MDYDSIQGMLWGVALGDALGAPHERRSRVPVWKYTGLLEFPPATNDQWQGRRSGVVGQVTDDTEMTLALASSIAENHCYHKDRVLDAYLTWANSKCPFTEWHTRTLMQGVKTEKGYNTRYTKRHSCDTCLWSQSSGCLMRSSPLAVLGADPEIVKADCMRTNPHPICIEACQVYVRAVAAAGAGSTPTDLIKRAAVQVSPGPMRKSILTCILKPDSHNMAHHSTGWVLRILAGGFLAVQQFSKCGTFEDTIDETIRRGGCTATNGAVAGALVGASLGYEAMLSEKRTGQNIRIMLAADPDKGNFKRPQIYQPGIIESLSERLARLSTRLLP